MVYDINPSGSSDPRYLTVFNDKLYFSAEDGTNGDELWVYDGMNDPTMVYDINPNTDSYPEYLTVSFYDINLSVQYRVDPRFLLFSSRWQLTWRE